MRRGRDGHSSGPPVAGRFSRPTRVSGPATACPPCGGRDTPIWSCSRRGLPCRPGHPVRGGLLPHPFTLTLRPRPSGGLLSVALSLGSPPAGVTRRLVAVEPGLSSSPRRETRPPGRLIRGEHGLWAAQGQPSRILHVTAGTVAIWARWALGPYCRPSLWGADVQLHSRWLRTPQNS